MLVEALVINCMEIEGLVSSLTTVASLSILSWFETGVIENYLKLTS